MAGHSHFKNIKRKKESSDKKKASAFSRASRLIISAVKEGGKDPQSNSSLRLAIEKAREADMPKENIDRAIKRGAGEGEEGRLVPFLYEAYGPDDVAFIIEGASDNTNRDIGEIKEILKKHNGKLADPGSVKWLFKQIAIIEIDNIIDEETEITLIDLGAEDIRKTDLSLVIYSSVDVVSDIKRKLKEKNIKIKSFTVAWLPKNKINPSSEKYKDLFEDLQNKESVEGVYINI